MRLYKPKSKARFLELCISTANAPTSTIRIQKDFLGAFFIKKHIQSQFAVIVNVFILSSLLEPSIRQALAHVFTNALLKSLTA
jgi:hypothetical protein